MSKYIFVVGGVISGTGKGAAAASMGLLLRMRGVSVQIIKFDPYLNTSASVLSPREHGEVWVTDDGAETDLDLGTYSRLGGVNVSKKNIYTSGMLYKEIIQEQEDGRYLGQTVQVIPHVTDKIQSKLLELGNDADIVIAEIGGTVGDLESGPFLEAARQFKQRFPDDVMVVLVSPILWIPTIKEFKTKPLQNSVKELQRFGIQPEMLLCRVDRAIPENLLDKIAHLTNVPRSSVFEAPDVKSIYQVPISFYDRHVDDLIADKFKLRRNGIRIHKYRELVEKYVNNEEMSEVQVAIVGKYENCDEAYISLKEALYHAGVSNNVRVNIRWLSAELLEQAKDMRGIWKHFDEVSAVIVPGGFDCRGILGKIRAINYVRQKKVPFLGICLGLQCAAIEFARNVCNIQDADSTEFTPQTANPVIHFVEGQEKVTKKCGTMRLGAYDCEIKRGTLAFEVYKKKLVSERHRHRYEVNNEYVEIMEKHGFHVSGTNPQTGLIEIMELDRKHHPFFIGSQAHPEFQSRLGEPNPLFHGLIEAAIKFKEAKAI